MRLYKNLVYITFIYYTNKYLKYTYYSIESIISILDQDVNRVKCYGYDDFANTSEVGDSEFKNEVKYGRR